MKNKIKSNNGSTDFSKKKKKEKNEVRNPKAIKALKRDKRLSSEMSIYSLENWRWLWGR